MNINPQKGIYIYIDSLFMYIRRKNNGFYFTCGVHSKVRINRYKNNHFILEAQKNMDLFFTEKI